jgi:hypothetical protein
MGGARETWNSPGEPSILDGAFLVVGDYISGRRISLFKLDGTFHAVYKTDGARRRQDRLRRAYARRYGGQGRHARRLQQQPDHDPRYGPGGDKLFAMPMADFLPYYCDFMVDADGNIFVFKMSEDPKMGPLVFQAYSPDGKLLCETELDRGAFDLPLDKSIHTRLVFAERSVFGILPLRGDELETPHLFRVRCLP